MGLMDKVKKILFDEDVIEVPVDSDELPERTPKKVKKEEPTEKKGFIEYHHNDDEEKEEDTIKEVVIPKEEVVEEKKKFNFPEDIDFEQELPSRSRNYDDLDLSYTEEKEIKRVETINEYVKTEEIHRAQKEVKDYRKMLSDENSKTEKKPFKNTPVISPVWGILDKNYKPEEIVEKREVLNKVNTGATPRSFGPVSYNDQPLPSAKKKPVVQESTSLKEDLVELNTTISELINDTVSPREVLEQTKIIEEKEEEKVPMHTIEDYQMQDNYQDDDIIQTSNYDDYVDTIEKISEPQYDINDVHDSIENDEFVNNNIEDAFETTSEFNSINERDNFDDEEEPLIDLETLISKKDDLEDDDEGLDNTIETDLFNLIDSMYKDDEEE